MEDRCVMCGEYVPEGSMVCPVCQRKYSGRPAMSLSLIHILKLIVPKATAKKLISMGVIDYVTLTYTKNSAVFKSDEYTIYTRLIEGKYFAYQKMFTEGEINTCALSLIHI